MTNSDIFKNTVFDHINPFSMIICSVMTGIFLGILLDVFSLTERFFGKNKVICFFTDLVSVVWAYLFLFVCAYNFNNGVIRWYCVVICLAAFRVYRRLLSSPFVKSLGFLISTGEKTAKFATKLALFPLKKIYDLLVVLYRRAVRRLRVLLRANAYSQEKNRITKNAYCGFSLAPHLKEEKEWNRTEKTKTAKRSASPLP